MKNLKNEVVVNEMVVVNNEVSGVVEMVKVKKEVSKLVVNGSMLDKIKNINFSEEIEKSKERKRGVKGESKSEMYLVMLRNGMSIGNIVSYFDRELRKVKESNKIKKEKGLLDELEIEIKVYWSEVLRVSNNLEMGKYEGQVN